jgi:hypothetical protein
MINENVQEEPATSYDVETCRQLAAIGIAKGKPFEPDARMKKILTDAAAVGNAVGRVLNWRYAVMHKVTLPKDIPARSFWSFTVYDNQSRSMLDTPQRYPHAGSQSYPSPAAEQNDDGSTTIYFAPEQPEGVKRGNWIQTMPGKGWFTILRLYNPLESFFDKSWRPSEIELVN